MTGRCSTRLGRLNEEKKLKTKAYEKGMSQFVTLRFSIRPCCRNADFALKPRLSSSFGSHNAAVVMRPRVS